MYLHAQICARNLKSNGLYGVLRIPYDDSSHHIPIVLRYSLINRTSATIPLEKEIGQARWGERGDFIAFSIQLHGSKPPV